MKTILYTFLALILTACAASGPKFQTVQVPDGSTAVLYVYRTHLASVRNSYPHVYIDGIRKGPLKDRGYLVYVIEPGVRKVEIKGDGMTWVNMSLVAETMFAPNTTYFFRFSSTYVGGLRIRHQLDDVEAWDALKELAEMNLSE